MKRSAKSKSKKPTKRRHHKPVVQKIKLKPSVAAAAAVCGRDLEWTMIVIGKSGTVDKEPAFLSLCTGDFAVWLVMNDSGKRLKLKLKDFKKTSSHQAVSPFDFVDNNVDIAAGETGVVVGQVVLKVVPPNPEKIKYTIEVRGPAAIDYDPELEIKPSFGG